MTSARKRESISHRQLYRTPDPQIGTTISLSYIVPSRVMCFFCCCQLKIWFSAISAFKVILSTYVVNYELEHLNIPISEKWIHSNALEIRHKYTMIGKQQHNLRLLHALNNSKTAIWLQRNNTTECTHFQSKNTTHTQKWKIKTLDGFRRSWNLNILIISMNWKFRWAGAKQSTKK